MEPNYILTAKDVLNAPEQQQNEWRYQCQTDLFFLSNHVLRSKKSLPLLDKVHGGICKALLQKYPTPAAVELLGDRYTPPVVKPMEEWSPVKERVILSSRGTLKSTIEAADFVQLILCDPNIRIILLSGKLSLAKTILSMVATHFLTNEVLGALFDSWVRDVRDYISAEAFVSPARHDVAYRDPTLQIGTFGSVKAGVHVEYLALDDCTNEINQATPELVEKSIQSYDDLDPLVEPQGYKTFTGTRWAVDDLPEYIRLHGQQMEEETGKQHVVYFFQPIWKVKKIDNSNFSEIQTMKLQAERDERERKHRLTPDDVELLWPEKLTAEYLWPQYRKNPRKFACQYLLNPELVASGIFTRSLLDQQTKPIDDCPLPHRSIIVINWDLSGLSGKGDFATGAVGIWEDTGRLYIVDAIVEKFRSSTEICNAIVGLYKKWMPDYHRIESANGSELISGELKAIAEMAELGRAFFPGFDPPTNEADAKYTRVMLLPGALERNEIQFFAGISCLEELKKQFEQFGKGKKSSRARKDDGPDCIAQMYEKWKNAVGPRAISFITPSEVVIDFQSELPKSNKDVDPHADERIYADIEFLQNFTAPHSGL